MHKTLLPVPQQSIIKWRSRDPHDLARDNAQLRVIWGWVVIIFKFDCSWIKERVVFEILDKGSAMSLNFFNVVDALQVWDNVKDSVKASIAVTKNRDTRDLDYSFITPTLLGNESVMVSRKTTWAK